MLLERLTTAGGGGSPKGGPLPPPPPGPRVHCGKNENLQKEILMWAIFGTRNFGFQAPSPPPPSSLIKQETLYLVDGSFAVAHTNYWTKG